MMAANKHRMMAKGLAKNCEPLPGTVGAAVAAVPVLDPELDPELEAAEVLELRREVVKDPELEAWVVVPVVAALEEVAVVVMLREAVVVPVVLAALVVVVEDWVETPVVKAELRIIRSEKFISEALVPHAMAME